MSDQTAVPRRRRKEARPKEILTAALGLFTERGFAATRVDDVAARAGVTKGTVYLYFPTKEELFKAVIRDALFPVIQAVEERIAEAVGSPCAADLLRSIIQVFPGLAGTPAGAVIKLVIAEGGNFPDIASFYVNEVIRRMRKVLTAIIDGGVARGEFRPVDAPAAIMCMFGPAALTLLWQHSFAPFDDTPIDMDSVCRTLSDLVVGGLLRRNGES